MCLTHRRQFLTQCGVGGIGLAAASVNVGQVQTNSRFQAHISGHFNGNENQLIRNALALVGRHLTSPVVRQNAYQMRWNTSIDPNYAQRIGLPAQNEWHRICMWVQLESYLSRLMPSVTIRPMNGQSDSWGRALSGLVRTLDVTRRTGQVEGQFILELNRGRMFRDAQGSDPARWAAIIVHEMMHNLGHHHAANDYNTHWQMNALQGSFLQVCFQEQRRISMERAMRESQEFAQQPGICSHYA